MKLNKSEKILLGIALLLSSFIIMYNLFYIPTLPNANITKKELVFQDIENDDNSEQVSNPVNINSASIEELKKIPGIGESIAQKIIEYREENGGFSCKQEITNVNGIGKKKYESMKNFITVN